jgi:hypothetical protein
MSNLSGVAENNGLKVREVSEILETVVPGTSAVYGIEG